MSDSGTFPRIMGLDYGSKTVGVAVTDPILMTAQGVETIWRDRENKLRQTLRRICELAETYEVSAIVVGLPLNMDDTEGERAKKSREFSELVAERTSLPVYLEDERLTTMEADDILEESGIPKENRKEHIDTLAAMLILESFCSKHYPTA